MYYDVHNKQNIKNKFSLNIFIMQLCEHISQAQISESVKKHEAARNTHYTEKRILAE